MSCFVDEVRLVQHHQVRAGELLLQELLERALVVERVVGLALRLHRGGVRREEPRRVGGRVEHRHHAVHRHPGAHARPAEGLDERLGEREPRGLDHDVIRWRVAAEQALDGGQEVVGDGAADAAVGELEDGVLLAAFDPASLDDLRIHADIPELVDHEREAPAPRMAEQVADHARLACAEESGDHGGGNAGAHGRWLAPDRVALVTVPWTSPVR